MTLPENPPAGRALDAMIAEKVFGWTNITFGKGNADAWRPTRPQQRGKPPGAKRHGGSSRIPAYSTDIAAAWEVLGRIHGAYPDGWPFSRRHRFYRELQLLCAFDGMRVMRVSWPDSMGIFRDRMPEFICRAALAAVGEP